MRILLNTARKWGLREHTGALGSAERAQHPCRTRARNAAEPGGCRAGRRDARHVDGWPADEVCTALEVSTGNQRVLLHRARAAVWSTLHTRRHDLVPT